MGEYNDEIMGLLATVLPKDVILPSRTFRHLRGRFLDYLPNKSMECSFPATVDFAGLSGEVENGILADAINHVFVAFATLTAGQLCKPVTLNCTAIRPVVTDGGAYTIEARLRYRSKSIIAIDAKLVNQDGKTAMTGTSTLMVARK